MKHVELSSHVRKGMFAGWLVRIGVVCAAAAFLLSPLSTQASTMITQGEFLGWLASATGEAADLPSNPTMNDLVQWAMDKGLNPTDGWQPAAKLTKDVLAQTLVQLFNLNPKKYGGDFVKNLLREGIVLPDEETLDRAGLVNVLDQFDMQSKLPKLSKNPFTPIKGNNGKFGDPLPPGFLNPRNPHYGQIIPGDPDNDPRPGKVGLGRPNPR